MEGGASVSYHGDWKMDKQVGDNAGNVAPVGKSSNIKAVRTNTWSPDPTGSVREAIQSALMQLFFLVQDVFFFKLRLVRTSWIQSEPDYPEV